MPVTLTLKTPVQAHGGMITALTLREPTGKDIRTAGLPYNLAADGGINIAAGPMGKMLSALAEVPPSTIDMLAAPDWNAAAMVVLGFITGPEEIPKAPPPSPPPNQ